MSSSFLDAAALRAIDALIDPPDVSDAQFSSASDEGGGGSSDAFELVESVVVSEASGEHLSDTTVHRGVTRLETLRFRVSAPLVDLTRKVLNYKHFPWPVGFRYVGTDTVKMGSYEPQAELHSFELPKAKIPDTRLACGAYRIEISYSASNFSRPLFTMKHEFTVV